MSQNNANDIHCSGISFLFVYLFAKVENSDLALPISYGVNQGHVLNPITLNNCVGRKHTYTY